MPQNKRSQSTEPITAQIAERLEREPVKVLGRIANSSNATLLVEVGSQHNKIKAIYKPLVGERPLWDFPPGLYKREVAAYLLSETLELGLVPLTIEREDLPYGVGSLQYFIEADFSKTYYEILEDDGNHPILIDLAAFDILANNSDRKGGHVLIDANGKIFAIDNGLCFHKQFKLRSVIWEFGKASISDHFLTLLQVAAEKHFSFLDHYLAEPEIASLITRANYLMTHGSLLDLPEDQRPYPWPII